ncbi:MAG: vitamin B12 dependent-methionine synthase activation domain-containing protein, partial [Phormidium sp.]
VEGDEGNGRQDAYPTREGKSAKSNGAVLSGEVKEVDTRRSEAVAVDIERPTPPFWGTQLLLSEEIPIEEVFGYLDLQALIAGQWQFRKPKEQSREEYDRFLAEKVYPILEYWKGRVVEENLLHPQLIYGYFPCLSEGNSLHIYDWEFLNREDAKDAKKEIARFDFPRQKSGRRLCIADFFAPVEGGKVDVFPMQAVTVGNIATEFAQKLFADDQYTDYLYFHGLAVQTAEALAEWVHARIRRELGFAGEEPDNIRDILAQRYRGSRYSFGYPACPNMQDQYKQLELLGTERINLFMDESEQLYPEQSTTAIITYHPAAKYFTA